jgi:uncharacterized coiled-coil protein SlyX
MIDIEITLKTQVTTISHLGQVIADTKKNTMKISLSINSNIKFK